MTKGSLFLFILVLTSRLFAQNLPEKLIQGKIITDSAVIEGIHVINLVNEESTVTDASGMFSIMAKEDDLLVFSSVHLEYARKSIGNKEYETGKVEVKMSAKITQLDEVVITDYPEINAKALGIIDYTPKKYTPAERKLRTAEEFKWYSPLLIPLGGMSVDGLINSISGRTAMLKKELEIEKKERLLQQLDIYFERNYFTENLKISEIYVDGFKFYAVEDSELATAVLSKDRNKIQFRLSALAIFFLEHQKDFETLNTEKKE
ncbi:MAG: carboxypeptidase-like regulatory domain-containing protein [Flavobacteriaceae bacterium]|jgi:hypothetical protein|nr:carboxypeptidase-like regulatory domain-containing protein [Flavobacteriaceae bacterium]